MSALLERPAAGCISVEDDFEISALPHQERTRSNTIATKAHLQKKSSTYNQVREESILRAIAVQLELFLPESTISSES